MGSGGRDCEDRVPHADQGELVGPRKGRKRRGTRCGVCQSKRRRWQGWDSRVTMLSALLLSIAVTVGDSGDGLHVPRNRDTSHC